MPPPTFKDCFCAQQGIGPEHYQQAVFKRTLYRRTRPFVWLLSLANRNYFTADHDLIRAVAELRSLRNFETEADNFHMHPYNRGWLRWKLHMRVSTSRLRSLMKSSLEQGDPSAGKSPSNGVGPSV